MEDLHDEYLRIFHLVTGETVIGYNMPIETSTDDSEVDDFVCVHYPYKILTVKTEDPEHPGNQHFDIELHRWIPCVLDHALLIRKNNIVALGKPDEDMVGCYSNLLQQELLISIDEEDPEHHN